VGDGTGAEALYLSTGQSRVQGNGKVVGCMGSRRGRKGKEADSQDPPVGDYAGERERSGVAWPTGLGRSGPARESGRGALGLAREGPEGEGKSRPSRLSAQGSRASREWKPAAGRLGQNGEIFFFLFILFSYF